MPHPFQCEECVRLAAGLLAVQLASFVLQEQWERWRLRRDLAWQV